MRRSPRLQINNKGFKPDTCANRRCLACSLAPPDLLPSQIKKLGLELCSIDENLLSEQALHQKKKTCKSVSTPKEPTNQNKDGKLKKKQQLKENKVPEEEEPSSESQEENGASQAAAAPKKSKK